MLGSCIGPATSDILRARQRLGGVMKNSQQADPNTANGAIHPHSHNLPKSAEDLTQRNVHAIIGLESAAKASISGGERLASRVAAFCGSMTFVWLHFIWFGGWVFYNTSSLFAHHPDPFPFTLLTLTVALESIFLSSFILIAQRHETQLTDQRNHLDLQINLLIEQENTKMLKMLKSIAAKVGAGIEVDPELAVLEESTRPEQLLDQIEKAIAKQ